MPMVFMNGETTNKYDAITSVATLDKLDELKDKISLNNEKMDELNAYTIHIENNLDMLKENTATDIDLLKCSITNQTNMLLYIANMKFVRFLNFFGQWFIYGKKKEVVMIKLPYHSAIVRVSLYPVFLNINKPWTDTIAGYYMHEDEYQIPLLSRIRYRIKHPNYEDK